MDEYRVDTPENIAFRYDVSGIGSRFLAALIDTAIIAILLIIVYMTTAAFLATSVGSEFISRIAQSWIVAGYLLLTFSIYWSYYIFFELIWNGQSPGKRIAGLRVIRTDGTPVTVVDSIVRNVVRLVDFLPTFYGVGTIVMLINAQSRRLGDLAAGTVVIKERREVTLTSLTQSAAQVVTPEPAPLPIEAAAWPIERLTEDDYYVVNQFLARRAKIANARSFARRLATTLHAKLDLPLAQLPTDEEAIAFLDKIAAVYRSLGPGAMRRQASQPAVSTATRSTHGASLPTGVTDSSQVILTCPRCGTQVGEGISVCPSCGLDLSGQCPRCHSPLPEGVDACPSCGQSVCPQCGSAVDDDAAVCPVCSARFTLICPRCGGAVAPRDTVCKSCGEVFN